VDKRTFEEFLQKIKSLTQDLRYFKDSQDKYQEKCINVLKNLYPTTEILLEADAGLYNYDVYMPEHNIVIELDGSTHFYGLTKRSDQKLNLLRRYILKRKLFQKAGIEVIWLEFNQGVLN
jgi:very-short-patch-repair endonuclease